MVLVPNVGSDRVLERLRRELRAGGALDLASGQFSLFAFEALMPELAPLGQCRLALAPGADLGLSGAAADRPFRNQLRQPWLAMQCAAWLRRSAEIRSTSKSIAQSLLLTDETALSGDCPFTTAGLGLTPGEHHGIVSASGDAAEAKALAEWFNQLWAHSPHAAGPPAILEALDAVAAPQSPSAVYHLVLHHLLGAETAPDPDRLADPATGIRDSAVWRKLYRFQRDGVLGALEKLDRLGGCIIADSVGLGKTFEALAVIKLFELRNQRVLVLCPKRLRDNWTLYKSNDHRNFLAADRFNYDVLNHTDLSRRAGMSGDINLTHLNWGNYDLIVIDESHNFRNKLSGSETRYSRLMTQIIKAGVRTRVLMLSATPVNNRLTDLKNQLAFITEGDDHALREHGIPSLDWTIRQAQLQFKRWLALDEPERTSARLLEMLGFDYFTLLDLTTIARSRKHIERYYGTAETGRFPDRLKPINFKPDVDRAGEFSPIKEINNEIRRLHLAVYAPLRYLLEHKKPEYEAKYSTKISGGQTLFSQVDREESLIHLLRVNTLKRMESAVSSFALTVGRQLQDVEAVVAKIEAGDAAIDEPDIADIDVDDPRFEPLLVGTKVRVLLRDIDLARWGQELREDRDRLHALAVAARQVTADRDAKLEQLRSVIAAKVQCPLNPGNRKLLVFTAFAETADYLYRELAPWAQEQFGLHAALVTGGDTGNQTTVPGLRRDLASILTSFSPRSKERPATLAAEPEIDLLIATDCISEGQNLQDCDYLVNYDIHWNPVRIIQRFGRIDRIGSVNHAIQLVNFWPNLELDEYIKLERRVSGKMKLLDISATGEENIIEEQSADEMNDLEYRRKQLLRLQDAVIDLEDLGGGVSITDLTFADFRLDLASFRKDHPGWLEAAPLGLHAVVTAGPEARLPPGILFLLRAEGEAASRLAAEGDYPLAPHYLVHIGASGAVALPYGQTKTILDALKRACVGRDDTDPAAIAAFDRATRGGEDMREPCRQLAAAIASVAGRGEERALASLFSPGGTHALAGSAAGENDFEVLALLAAVTA